MISSIHKYNYPNCSMYELLKESSKDYLDKTAFICNGNKIKYIDFLSNIDECANSFVEFGIKKEDIVSIIPENMLEFITCIYAFNKLGITCNMIHFSSGEEEIKKSFLDTRSNYLIVSERQIKKINNIKNKLNIKKIIYISEKNVSSTFDKIKKLFHNDYNIIDHDYISYNKIIFRGKYKNIKIKKSKYEDYNAFIIKGSNKYIMLSNLNINASSINFNSNDSVLKDKKYMFDYSISTGFGITSIHKALISGSKIILIKNLSYKNIPEAIIKYKPNVLECTTNLLNVIMNNKKFKDKDMSYLKLIICSKEKLNKTLKEKMNLFLKKHNSLSDIKSTYGMKESTSNVAITDVEDEDIIGNPYQNIEIKIFSDSLKECKPFEVGEICINGPVLMMGYLNDKESTNKILKKHKDNKIWLHCGDLGYIDEKGHIHFKSSLKRVIISSGNEIYPSEVENIILAHPFVQACSIVGVPHPYKKEVVKVYIVLKRGLILNSEIKKSIKEYCEKNISDYALPYAYAYRKELPKTIYGKVSYEELLSGKDEEE